jgi:hypothetical protein
MRPVAFHVAADTIGFAAYSIRFPAQAGGFPANFLCCMARVSFPIRFIPVNAARGFPEFVADFDMCPPHLIAGFPRRLLHLHRGASQRLPHFPAGLMQIVPHLVALPV